MKKVNIQKRTRVRLSENEVKELKDFFNAKENWGIRTQLFNEYGIAANNLDRVLWTGRTTDVTIAKIRKFKVNYNPITA